MESLVLIGIADSIVRGTTSKEIIQMAKDVGAKKVIVASCAPPIRFSNVYGIDMPSRHELVAYNRDEEAIAQEIGADLVIFQTLPDLISSVRQFNPSIEQFDCSVFTGEYVTGGVDAGYLEHIESLRADAVKGKMQGGDIGALEGKGGGAVSGGNAPNGTANGIGDVRETKDQSLGCSGPMNGADDTIGLYNHHQKI
jgi:amidophosphoribosyltransferase